MTQPTPVAWPGLPGTPGMIVPPSDMPGYDELPDGLEARTALPARFHIPVWDDTSRRPTFVCAVCWDDGTASNWPCATATAHGGEVFANEYTTRLWLARNGVRNGCAKGCPAGDCLRYEQSGTQPCCRGPESGSPAAEAACGHASGCRGLIFAALALRDEMGTAVTDLDITPETCTRVSTAPAPDPALGPTHILNWHPRYEHGTAAFWDLQAAPGWEHLDRPDPWPVPDLPPGRAATAPQIEEWAYGKLGYRVTAVRLGRLAVSIRRLRAWPQPRWALLTEVPEACDGTHVGVIATDADDRYLLVPDGRPGPLKILTPPTGHVGDRPWEDAARGALALAGAIASVVYPNASGWRQDRCNLVPGPAGTGHSWTITTVLDAVAISDTGEWVTRAELQQLADRTIGYATGRLSIDDLNGQACLAPVWIVWLAGLAIDVTPADALDCERITHAVTMLAPADDTRETR